jgi:hemerythrin
MALITWDKSFSVNIVEIDKQHQKLIGMITDLNEAMRQGKGKAILGQIISGLIGYVDTHFKTEEKYFEQFGYLETDAHKKEHQDFTAKVGDFKKGFEGGQLGLSIEVMNFLSDWLQNHIKVVDKKYAPLFIEKGLK